MHKVGPESFRAVHNRREGFLRRTFGSRLNFSVMMLLLRQMLIRFRFIVHAREHSPVFLEPLKNRRST